MMSPLSQLGPAPASVDDGTGQPRFGMYEGSLPEVALETLSSPYLPGGPLQRLRRKRWYYQVLATHEVIAVTSIADLGHTASAFATVVDLSEKKAVYDGSFLGPPGPQAHVEGGPGKSLSARFRLPAVRFRALGPSREERYRSFVQVGGLLGLRPSLKLEVEVLAVGGASPLTVIAPGADGRGVNVTQKWAGRLAFGTVQAGAKTYNLDGGVAGLDYTHGYPPRKTAWRWAMALGRLPDGTPLGVNLVSGFNDAREGVSENAVWVGDELFPVGLARFSYNREDPLDRWSVGTEDGAVDLLFKPIHVHREERDFKLVRSRFAQPLGTFEGSLKVGGKTLHVTSLSGVTEDQDILW